MERKTKTRIALLLLLLSASAVVGGWVGSRWFSSSLEPEIRYLPSETVSETVIDPATAQALVAEQLRSADLMRQLGLSQDEAGYLRDDRDRLVEVVRLLQFETPMAEPPDPDAVKEILHSACEEQVTPLPLFRTHTTAPQFRGIRDEDSNPQFAWTARTRVWMKLGKAPEVVVHDEAILLTTSSVVSTEKVDIPPPVKRWSLGILYPVIEDSSFVDSSQFGSLATLYGGDLMLEFDRRFFPAKRISPEVGLVAGRRSAFVRLAVDF